MNIYTWEGMDLSSPVETVSIFFRRWGCGSSHNIENFVGVEDPEAMMSDIDNLSASSVEDVPERVVIAMIYYENCDGEMYVMEPIRP